MIALSVSQKYFEFKIANEKELVLKGDPKSQ